MKTKNAGVSLTSALFCALMVASVAPAGASSAWTVPFTVKATGTTSDLDAIIYNGSLYVAVGLSGTIMRSPDGQSWKAATYAGTANDLLGVAWGNGLFVCVGQNGWVVTSPDATNWTSTSSGATVANLNAIGFANGVFVAVGDNGTIATSADGVNWTTSSSGTTDNLIGVAFNASNGKFVAVGEFEASVASYDGLHWGLAGNNLDQEIQGLCSGNGVFVAVDFDGTIYTSPSGTNWATHASTDIELYGVAYDGSSFVACGIGGAVFISPNGTNWAQVQTSVVNHDLLAVAAGDSQFVVTGTAGISLSALDSDVAAGPVSAVWNLVTSPAHYNLNSVAFNGQTYVAVSDETTADVVSSNAVNWTVRSKGLTGTDEGVAWGNGTFVAVDYYGNIYTSTSATNWTQQAATGVEMYAVAYGGGVWVVTAVTGQVFTSADTIHWSPQNTGLKGDIDALVYANNQFVAVADDGTIASSTNGTAWTIHKTSNTNPLYGITYANGLYVAVGRSGTILASSDGVTWILQKNAPVTANDLNAIAWGNAEFMAVGIGGWTVRSPDGTNWISSTSATTSNLMSIIYANGSFLAVGGDGAIVQSPSLAPAQLGPIVLLSGGEVQVGLTGTPGMNYSVEISPDLISWTPFTNLSLTASQTQFVDSQAASISQSNRFYRALALP